MKLYPHQQRFLDENPATHLLAYDTGLGKTYTSLMWAKKNNPARLLIVCPKTIITQWEEECETHLPTTIKYKVITKEYFRDKWDKNIPIDAIIMDEAHVFASTTSRLHKEMKKYLNKHRVPLRLLLTATPVLSKGSMNIYALTTILGNIITLPRWREAFMYQKEQRIMGGRIIRPWVDREDQATKDKLIRYINEIGTTVDKSEVYEVPEQKEIITKIPTPPDLEARLLAEMDGETSMIAIWTARHRLEQTYKYDKVQEIASNYERIIIVSRYLSDIEKYQELFPGAHTLIGKTKNRNELLKEVRESNASIILVNSAISEGWEHPDCDAIIFASLDFSIKNFIQMKGRALRMNKPSPTDIHILIVEGGSDENVYTSIRQKRDFNVKMFINRLTPSQRKHFMLDYQHDLGATVDPSCKL